MGRVVHTKPDPIVWVTDIHNPKILFPLTISIRQIARKSIPLENMLVRGCDDARAIR